MTVPRFLVAPEQLIGSSVTLTGPEFHHLRVRRLRRGDTVVLIDGSGRERRGTLESFARGHAVVQLEQPRSLPDVSLPRLTLAQGILKADKLDLVIAKATELGVSELVLFVTQRTVPTGDLEHRRARWQRIATSAAKQSLRAEIPRIAGPLPFTQLLAYDQSSLRLLFWENAPGCTLNQLHADLPSPAKILISVGPEGGFTDAEVHAAAAVGFKTVRLNLPILRAETASIVAVALCQFLWRSEQPATDTADPLPPATLARPGTSP